MNLVKVRIVRKVMVRAWFKLCLDENIQYSVRLWFDHELNLAKVRVVCKVMV